MTRPGLQHSASACGGHRRWWRFDELSCAVARDAASRRDGLLLGGSSGVVRHWGGVVAFTGGGVSDVAGMIRK